MHDQPVLLDSPLTLGESRAEYIDPAFPTLLADSIWQSFTDLMPLLCAMDRNLLLKYFVLLGRPWDGLTVVYLIADKLKVPLVALYHRLAEMLADTVPLGAI